MGKNDAEILAHQKARSAASKKRVERNPKINSERLWSGATGIKRRK